MITVIIAAAGAGKRMGMGKNKIFLELNGIPIIARSCAALASCAEIGELLIAAAPDEVGIVDNILQAYPPGKPWRTVAGGGERQYSIANALEVMRPETEIVLVHDAARPLIQAQEIRQVIAAARYHKAAGVAVPVKDTIKEVNTQQFAVATPPRQMLWAMQTPQAFDGALLRRAYSQAAVEGFLGTDDASLVERLGIQVKLVCGSYSNIKITNPEDMVIAKALLEKGVNTMRIGIGYDVHRLVEGRKLIMGGVEVPHTVGLDGHSDADVLLHVIKDALLGAAALGDIGRHFPDTDMQYKGVSSLKLLARVRELLTEKGFQTHNIDATIMAEKPKLAPYIPQMSATIATTLGISIDQVNIKATTSEGLGFIGRQEGIAAQAVVTIVDI